MSWRKMLGAMSAEDFLEENLCLSVGEQIRSHREAMRRTQKELGDMCGLSCGDISRIERGRVMPSGNRLVRICKAIKMPVIFFPEQEVLRDYSHRKVTKKMRSEPRSRAVIRSSPPKRTGKWIDVPSIAERLGISCGCARQRIKRAKLKRFFDSEKPLGHKYWYRLEDVEKHLKGWIGS